MEEQSPCFSPKLGGKKKQKPTQPTPKQKSTPEQGRLHSPGVVRKWFAPSWADFLRRSPPRFGWLKGWKVWAPVFNVGPPSWEIPPQKARVGKFGGKLSPINTMGTLLGVHPIVPLIQKIMGNPEICLRNVAKKTGQIHQNNKTQALSTIRVTLWSQWFIFQIDSNDLTWFAMNLPVI